MAKDHLDHHNQLTAETAAENVTPLATNAGENTSELLLQLFDLSKHILT